MKKIFSYLKMGYYYINKNFVNREDYAQSYDKISITYESWIEKVGKHSINIIKPEYLKEFNGKINILDFACGTGFITRNILNVSDENNLNINITDVDISYKMLEKSKVRNNDPRVTFINSDGIDFLKRIPDNTYDAVYFGWALSYFNHEILFKEIFRVLKPGGIFSVITNVLGTLDGIEQLFLSVMAENPNEVKKIMEIKFNLPDGEEGLDKWMKKFNFIHLDSSSGEEILKYDTPEDLYSWLNKSGALAGTDMIFYDKVKVESKIIEKIKLKKYKNEKYEINHKFVYGIYMKG